ncbi:MAG: glycosyltransferase [bacterium]|nr:glycosyltransferase [bacterium]
MKIAIFSDNFYPELSGISDSIILLSKELDKLGHKIDFYVPECKRGGEMELNLGQNIKINRLFSLPASFVGDKARLVLPVLFRPTYKKFKADIIHSQLFFGVGLEALALAKFFKIPLIGTNHTSITDFVSGAYVKNQSLKYATWYYNRCDYVTAPSQSVFDEMGSYGFNRPRRVISNPVNMEIFYPLKDKLKFKKKLKLSEPTIVCAGRLSAEKNIQLVIKAFARAKRKIKDINLAIAGAGKRDAELRRLAGKLGVSNQVKFLGSLSHAKLAELYNAADIYAIASTSETQSLTLMQALACGLPAVAVKARALPEYVNDKNGFAVKPGDEKAMAEKFILLLENQKMRENLSNGAVVYAQQFSAPKIAKKWESLYGEVIKNFHQST